MTRCKAAALLALAGLAMAPTRTSDPTGVYALIDRVVFEPDSVQPTRVQLWGVFAIAAGVTVREGRVVAIDFNAYNAARRGYMYFVMDTAKSRATRAAWNDLNAMAGSGRPIAFGHRWGEPALARPEPNGRIRRASEAPTRPDTFPLGIGVVRNLGTDPSHPPTYDVVHVPAPLAPADGGRAAAGAVQLVARNIADADVMYHFEIEAPGGETETSGPLPPGEDRTEWSPFMRLRDGRTYTWRVWITKNDYTGQPAEAAFRAGG